MKTYEISEQLVNMILSVLGDLPAKNVLKLMNEILNLKEIPNKENGES